MSSKTKELYLMENNLVKSFTHETLGSIRTISRDDEIWFVLSDVCRSLGLSNPTTVANRIDEDERSKFNLGRQGNATIINESGLYSVILRSDKPQAKTFRKWVTSEVLPSIPKQVVNSKIIFFEKIRIKG